MTSTETTNLNRAEATALVIGSGFLGRRVIKRWREAGWTVHATTRSRARFPELEQLGAIPHEWDVLTGGESLPATDVICYAVGFDRNAGRTMNDVYIKGVAKTIQALSANYSRFSRVCRRFLYVSSTGVYGDANGEWVDETTAPNPADPVGEICLEAERTLIEAIEQDPSFPSLVILRLSGIYGPGRMLGLDRLRANEPIAQDPDGLINLIHVDDAAAVVDAASRASAPRSLYLVSDGQPVARREFYGYLAKRIGAPEPEFAPAARTRARGDRRIANVRMLNELGVVLAYPNFRAGLESLLPAEPMTGRGTIR